MDIVKETKLIGNYLIGLRKDFHKYPELSMQEHRTSRKIKEELDKINVKYKEGIRTEVVATIGHGEGKVIALRADMDALRIKENTGVRYQSENEGVMHACGHDAHMASLLGAAMILKKYENDIPGKIVLIFQPGEECSSGARLISEHGYIDEVEEIFGLHVFGDIECGKISIEEGPRMAASNKFTIKITGKSGHAGKPQQCIDATIVCAAIVMNLQSIISREIDPLNSAVVTIGHIKSGETHNIISGEAFIEGTIRCFNASTTKHIQTSIKRIAYSTAIAYGATASVEYDISHHPAVINDPKVTKTALDAAKKIFDEKDIIKVPRMMLGEDFSVYQKRIPGVFVFVGAGNEEIGRDYPTHNDKFNIDEKAVLISTQLYVAFALESLGGEEKKQHSNQKLKEEVWN